MSDSYKEYMSDLREYELLCKQFNKTPLYIQNKWGEFILDCYGAHSKLLKEKSEKNKLK